MTGKAWGNAYRNTIVCVDSYENSVLTGRLYNPYLESGKEFGSLMQFLQEMERTLDDMAFPQSFTAVRTFAPVPKPAQAAPETERQAGKLATFSVRILFRQNASWQGSVTWMEGGMEQSFRSALELAFLMDNALCQVGEEDE